MSDLPNTTERKAIRIATLAEELRQVILKVNYHYHSGYEKNDLRKSESIFMNFFKKQPSIIHSRYMMRIKNRDFKITFDDDNFVNHIRFNDLSYESYQSLIDLISDLNEACLRLDYSELREKTNLMEKYLQIADKDIQFLNDFKFR